MATSRISTSSILQGFPKSRSLLAGNAGFDPGATWLIQRISTTSVSTITFSSIPQNYKHLQLRYQLIESSGYQDINCRFNGDTGSNYYWHFLGGNGSSAYAGSSGGTTTSISIKTNNVEGTVPTYPNVGIVDIHDYASSTKYKTVRTLSGSDKNGVNPNGEVQLLSGLWSSTSAVTSLTIRCSVTWNAGSTFALYGMVG
jgi:hypothetical protein